MINTGACTRLSYRLFDARAEAHEIARLIFFPPFLPCTSITSFPTAVPQLLADSVANVAKKSGLAMAEVQTIKTKCLAASAANLLRGDDLLALTDSSLRVVPTGESG